MLIEADDLVARVEARLGVGGGRSGIGHRVGRFAGLDQLEPLCRRNADHAPPGKNARGHLNLERGPIRVHAFDFDGTGREGDGPLNVLEGHRRTSADARNAVSRLKSGVPRRKTGLQRADHRRRHFNPVTERHGVKQDGRQHVHGHASRNDRHPLADAFRGVRPGVLRDLLARQLAGIHVILAQHLDVAAERNGREGVFRLAVLAAPENRTEADAEPLDKHIAPLGDGEVSQLVKENDQPDADQHGQDAPGLADVGREAEGQQPAGVEMSEHVHDSALQARASARVHWSISSNCERDGEGSN